MMTHILIRSLLENYFWLLYIFDGNDAVARGARFNRYLNGFKREYVRLYNEPQLPNKADIEAPDQSWRELPKPLDTSSMLAQVLNVHGNRLNYLYFLYRITSFDTHGKSMRSLFVAAFGKDCNFPFLKIVESIDLIANEYLAIWQKVTPNP